MGATMEFDYESERLDPSIAWYERRSGVSRRWFYAMQATQLVASTLVTALAAWPAELVPRPLLAAVSAAAALAAGCIGLFGWQQHWIRYRATAETLKREKYLYRSNAGAYANAPGMALLAERCEAVESSENTTWSTAMERAGKAAESGA
jgi:hypothetical protein